MHHEHFPHQRPSLDLAELHHEPDFDDHRWHPEPRFTDAELAHARTLQRPIDALRADLRRNGDTSALLYLAVFGYDATPVLGGYRVDLLHDVHALAAREQRAWYYARIVRDWDRAARGFAGVWRALGETVAAALEHVRPFVDAYRAGLEQQRAAERARWADDGGR